MQVFIPICICLKGLSHSLARDFNLLIFIFFVVVYIAEFNQYLLNGYKDKSDTGSQLSLKMGGRIGYDV